MLQAEVPELSEGREKAVYLVGGRFTHAIAKGALFAPGGGFLGGVYQEHPVIVEATPDEKTFAVRVFDAVSAVTGSVPLYGRIDMVETAESDGRGRLSCWRRCSSNRHSTSTWFPRSPRPSLKRSWTVSQ